MSKPQSYNVLGVRIDALTMAAAARVICQRAASSHPPTYVTKPYVEFLDRASRDPEIAHILNGSFLSLPDSVAVQWAVHYLYDGPRSLIRLFSSLASIILRPQTIARPIPERFAGADFAWKLLEEAERSNLTVYLIGHPKGSEITHTAAIISERLSSLRIVGTFDGFEANTREHDLVADLKAKRPDLILVGTGFPRQEFLMASLIERLDNGVLIGEGGTFDYESFGGHMRRAPAWMRRMGLEWLWRLALEPSRLVRQTAIPRFIWRLYHSRNKV